MDGCVDRLENTWNGLKNGQLQKFDALQSIIDQSRNYSKKPAMLSESSTNDNLLIEDVLFSSQQENEVNLAKNLNGINDCTATKTVIGLSKFNQVRDYSENCGKNAQIH